MDPTLPARRLLEGAAKMRGVLGDFHLVLHSPLPWPSRLDLLSEQAVNQRLAREGALKGYRAGGMTLEFARPENGPFLHRELFLNHPYYFRLKTPNRIPAPYILDCGANVGVSVAYFKYLYPLARIVAFEPNPAAAALLRGNIAANRLTGVDLHETALAGEDGEVRFTVDGQDMGGSTASRQWRGETKVHRVRAERLSPYLDREVDFLKLDIEGSEGEVLAECGERLKLVRRLFVEYHFLPGAKGNNLSEILEIIGGCGFEYTVTPGVSFTGLHPVAWCEHLDHSPSLNIFAVRRGIAPSGEGR